MKTNSIKEPDLKDHIERVGIEFYSRWKEIALSKTTKFIVDNRGKTVPTVKNGIPLIATNCINNNSLYPIYSNVRYISQETFDNWFRSHPEPGDIILTLKGSQNGAVCLVPNPVGFAIAQDMVALRVNEKVIDPHFLFAALRTQEVQNEIKNLDVSGVIPHLKKSDFDKLLLPYPDMVTQKIIGSIYFSLSNKIDLLHRQNKTLEQIAETLFRQWFVEEAEESWEEKSFGELIETTLGGEWGKENPEGDFLLQVQCIRGTDIADLETGIPLRTPIRFIKQRKFESIEIKVGDLVMEISGGTDHQSTGRTTYINDEVKALFKYPLVFSNFCRLIRPKKKEYSFFLYSYIHFLYVQGDLFNLENGSSGIKNLNYKALLFELEYKMPDKQYIIQFYKEVELYFYKINKNKFQIQTLAQARDNLLPKLMSGEVRVQIS